MIILTFILIFLGTILSGEWSVIRSKSKNLFSQTENTEQEGLSRNLFIYIKKINNNNNTNPEIHTPSFNKNKTVKSILKIVKSLIIKSIYKQVIICCNGLLILSGRGRRGSSGSLREIVQLIREIVQLIWEIVQLTLPLAHKKAKLKNHITSISILWATVNEVHLFWNPQEGPIKD